MKPNMRTIDRSMLLEALGWTDKQNWHGSTRWTKASSDLLTSASFVVEQDALTVKARAVREESDADFNLAVRPLFAVEFKVAEGGRMMLTSLVENGVEQNLGPGSQEHALERAAQVRRSIGGRPKCALVRELAGPHVKPSGGKL